MHCSTGKQARGTMAGQAALSKLQASVRGGCTRCNDACKQRTGTASVSATSSSTPRPPSTPVPRSWPSPLSARRLQTGVGEGLVGVLGS